MSLKQYSCVPVHMPGCVCVCVCVIYPYAPRVWWVGVDYETHRDLIPTGSGCVTLSSHLGFCSLLWNSRNDWTFIQSLHASVNRTSGRLKKASFCDVTQRRFNTSETLYRVPSKWEKGKSSAEERVFFFNLSPNWQQPCIYWCYDVQTFNEIFLTSLILDVKYPQQNLLRKLWKRDKNTT